MQHPVVSSPPPTFPDLGIGPRLETALRRAGVRAPFPIQTATIPDAVAGRDVLGRGATGSGKTLAFGLPMISRLAGRTARSRHPLAIVLVPTRELAMQVHDALEPLAHAEELRLKLVVGGAPFGKQVSALNRGVEILVATPGRLTDLVQQRFCDLSDVELTVLDEADHMADMGFLPAVSALLDATRPGGQRLLFSATLDRDVDTLVRRYLTDPATHSTSPPTAAVQTMEHHVMHVEPQGKVPVTAEIAARSGRSLLFVRTKHGADRLATQLNQRGVAAGALHGGKTQGARNRVLAAFRDGSVPVLVATDVAARGIHVDDVGLVLQVDPPQDSKDYLHRSGRTARAGGAGTVVTLVLPHQRREVDALTSRAGVTAKGYPVRPGDERVTTVTGARQPSGIPVPERPEPAPRSGGLRRGPRAGGARPGSGARPPARGPAAGGSTGRHRGPAPASR